MTKLTQSYMCGDATKPLIYETIGNYLDKTANEFPHNEALVVRHQDIRWSYAEFQVKVERMAAGLLQLGIKPGDRVGMWGPNSYEWIVTQFATAKMGAIMVCINPAYQLHELEYVLNKVECRVLVTAESFKSSHYLEMLQTLAPELATGNAEQLSLSKLPFLQCIIRMGNDITAGMLNFEAVSNRGDKAAYDELQALSIKLQPDDPINIQFTSGTTGKPKGAILTHCNILNNGYLAANAMQLTDQDRLCAPVPLYHCFGMVLTNLACITKGATIIYPSASFDPLITLQTVAEERCTALHGVPTMFIAELDHPRVAEFDLSTLRTGLIGGSPCPVEVMKRIINDMHMRDVLIIYGQTETSPINHITLPEDPIDKRVNTVGRAAAHLQIKLIDDQGRVVAVGEKGEICIRGYSVMQSYWGDEEKTRETIDTAGWLHSGDIGTMSDDGYVTIVGRIKDLVIRGGENIYPREVEEFLYQHPNVLEVQVFGVPDNKMGEELCAWIKLHDGKKITAEEIKAFCKGKIAHYKIPHYIEFVDEYPMTVSGKAQKFKMRDVMAERFSTARAS